ncbi:hypothetical protein LSP04_09070 [Levilactobacillus spicheri]|uniref:Uncharacterized protein n=1 Tax=Levilactobacillus spicheri TaxID=216463 RepID=A0ABQ0WN97_9LACO|nr:hypothetical protein LSP04_09070 [Levilactobacillus spicheri]
MKGNFQRDDPLSHGKISEAKQLCIIINDLRWNGLEKTWLLTEMTDMEASSSDDRLNRCPEHAILRLFASKGVTLMSVAICLTPSLKD